MPKSLEHYQQESGRAGRDGLEAECCLFYSGGDYGVWKSILMDSRGEGVPPSNARAGCPRHKRARARCPRHGASQQPKIALAKLARCMPTARTPPAGAGPSWSTSASVPAGQLRHLRHLPGRRGPGLDDALITAQKILSCVLRLGQRFGGGYTALVLTGSRDQRILDNRHDALSTYGLLKDYDKRTVHDWIEQLAGQGFLEKTGEYNVLSVTPEGLAGPQGGGDAATAQARRESEKRKSKARSRRTWEGVDQGPVRGAAHAAGHARPRAGVPAYIIFGDAALRDMAQASLDPATLPRRQRRRRDEMPAVWPGHDREDPRLLPRTRPRDGPMIPKSETAGLFDSGTLGLDYQPRRACT